MITRAIADAEGVAIACHRRRLVMLGPVVSQSRTVLCTMPGKHNVDAPF